MRSALRKLAGPFFIGAGALHFIKPQPYRAIMPPYVPAHKAMVYASGVAEIAGAERVVKAIDCVSGQVGADVSRALAPHGVTHIDMPCTPARVWAAMQGRPEPPQ